MQILMNTLLIIGVTSTITCNSDFQIENSQNISVEEKSKYEVSQTRPEVSFEVKVLKENDLQDCIHGDNSETELIFSIDGTKIDSFKEFGQVDIEKGENGNLSAYYASDLSQVTISTEIIDDNNIVLSKILFFDGEEREVWTRTYSKSNSTWKISKCEGDCA